MLENHSPIRPNHLAQIDGVLMVSDTQLCSAGEILSNAPLDSAIFALPKLWICLLGYLLLREAFVKKKIHYCTYIKIYPPLFTVFTGNQIKPKLKLNDCVPKGNCFKSSQTLSRETIQLHTRLVSFCLGKSKFLAEVGAWFRMRTS